MQLGYYIRKNRESLNLSQTKLANILNVSTIAVSKWENDVVGIDLKNAISLSNIFGVSLDDFYKGVFINDIDVNNKYSILKYNQNELNAEDILISIKSLYLLIEESKKHKLSIDKENEFNLLSKALINNICYEKYFDYYEDLMGNVIIKNYKEERDSNIDINYFYELNKELKKEKIRNIHFIFNIDFVDIINKCNNYKILNELLDYDILVNQMLYISQINDLKKLAIIIIKGYKFNDYDCQKRITNKVINKFIIKEKNI